MELRDVILTRRSVRKYTDRPIENRDLAEILEAGLCAPSGTNLQPWYFVVVKSEAGLRTLTELMGNVFAKLKPLLERRFEQHPETVGETGAFLTGLGGAKVCVLAFLLKPDYAERDAALESVSAAIENMLLAAWGKGIGSCWLTGPKHAGYGPELERCFAPGKGEFVGMVTLGYPAVEPKMPPRREGRFTIV